MKNTIFLLLIFFVACTHSKQILTKDFLEEKLLSIKLIDTFKNELKLESASSITEAEFHPLYIGKLKHSIPLDYWSEKIKYRTYDWEKYRNPDSTNLLIFVDTSQIIGSSNKYIIPPPPKEFEEKKNERKKERDYFRGATKSHPVFIKNISNTALKVGLGEYIPLVIEAKDSLGNWQPIQKPYIYFCGTGLTNFYIPPGELLITNCKLFQGDFKTSLRLTYGFDGKIKSNEFKGKINIKQFEKPL